jgi:hypothetical protein
LSGRSAHDDERGLLVGVEDLASHQDLVEVPVGNLADGVDRRFGDAFLQFGLHALRVLGHGRDREHEGDQGGSQGGKDLHGGFDRSDR